MKIKTGATGLAITVAADGSGDFTQLQAAVDAIPDHGMKETVITIKKGVYHEKVFIDKPFVTLVGESADETVLEYGDYAKMKGLDGEEIRTFCTYTLFTGGHDFRAENLTIINTAGKGEIVGQAVAAYVDGDRSSFVNCRFIGNQDTLFTGPLPPFPLTVKTFGGPRDGLPRTKSRQYYKNCYIQGDIDFIFGSATAVFEDCEIFSNRLGPGQSSFVTAPSTPEGERYGYVFHNCRLTGDAEPQCVYLGRPWRDFAKSAFINCSLGAHIASEGWHNWDKPWSESTTEFAEYGCTGPGSANGADFTRDAGTEALSCGGHENASELMQSSGDTGTEVVSALSVLQSGIRPSAQNLTGENITGGGRVSWSKQLTAKEAEQYRIDRVLSGRDGWRPWE